MSLPVMNQRRVQEVLSKVPDPPKPPHHQPHDPPKPYEHQKMDGTVRGDVRAPDHSGGNPHAAVNRKCRLRVLDVPPAAAPG